MFDNIIFPATVRRRFVALYLRGGRPAEPARRDHRQRCVINQQFSLAVFAEIFSLQEDIDRA
jgi:hypothetical protein